MDGKNMAIAIAAQTIAEAGGMPHLLAMSDACATGAGMTRTRVDHDGSVVTEHIPRTRWNRWAEADDERARLAAWAPAPRRSHHPDPDMPTIEESGIRRALVIPQPATEPPPPAPPSPPPTQAPVPANDFTEVMRNPVRRWLKGNGIYLDDGPKE